MYPQINSDEENENDEYFYQQSPNEVYTNNDQVMQGMFVGNNVDISMQEIINAVSQNPEEYINKIIVSNNKRYSVTIDQNENIVLNEVHEDTLDEATALTYSCDQCPKEFRYATGYTKHYAEEHNQKIFVCRKCPQCFLMLTDLFLHARRIHNDAMKEAKDPTKYKFHCDKCEYMTNNGGTFEHHNRAHTGEKPFACDFCGKTFAQKTNMKTHRSRHVNTQIFPCTLCNKNFKTHDIYLSHLRTREHELREHVNENKNVAIKIACLGCNETFTKIFNIQNHLKVCNQALEYNFRCLVCDVQIASYEDIKTHLKSHKDTLTISCPICFEGGFDQYNKLNHHISRNHNLKVIRKNVCRYCEITFEHQTDLKNHIKEYHSEEINSRKSRGAMGRYHCIYPQCSFTATTQMLIDSHALKHERGIIDYVKPEPKKRGRKSKFLDIYPILNKIEFKVKEELEVSSAMSVVSKRKCGRPRKNSGMSIMNKLTNTKVDDTNNIKTEDIDLIVNDFYDN